MECSVTVDTFGKECLEQKKHLYYYRNEIGVPPLAMVDDVVCVANCGVDSVAVNAFINAKTRVKKLQFGVDKCHHLHIGKDKNLCPDLFIDNWEVVKVDSTKTGFDNLDDRQTEPHKMEVIGKDKYLGDVISTTGKNTDNVIARKEKSNGIVKQIIAILEDICFGPFHFEVAVILRDSLFLSSVLVNSEAWYDLTDADIEVLEQADENLLRKILEAPISTPKCMLYLETGCKPVRYIVMTRRLMFFHYILNEEENSLISRFYRSQVKNPYDGDWCTTVMANLEELEILIDAEQIKECSKNQFKTLVDKCITKAALAYLNREKGTKSKVLHIKHKELKMQTYLEPNKHSIHLKKSIFLLRSRMLEIGENYKRNKKKSECPLCKDKNSPDSQAHLLMCPELEENEIVTKKVEYDDLFDDSLEDQAQVAQIILRKFKRRKIILKKRKT